MSLTDEVVSPTREIAVDGSCKTCRSKYPGSRWDGPPGLRPTDLIRSADQGCPTCKILLEGIRRLDEEWEHADINSEGMVHIPNFDVYEGKEHGQESIVVMLTIHRPEPRGFYEKVRRTWLEFFTLPDHSSSLSRFGPAKLIPDTTLSQQFVDQAKQWLQECDSRHSECNISTDSPLPTRIIDVGLEHEYPYAVLQDGKGMAGKYACLSYCWGKSRPFVTTTSNRAQRSYGFAIDELPATLRDAVHFTRKLGLRYLWVDAVCILQDDRGDWERECANMSRVYGQSYVTLCASHAADINEGLSMKLNEAKDGPCLLQETHDEGGPSIWVRRELSHHQFITLNDAAPGTWAEDRYPLVERAWALQEHLLSPRVIQFATHELVWECWEHSSCCCGRLNHSKLARSFLLRPTSNQEGFDELTKTWRNVLHAYSSGATTDPGDKLPALSGLAHSLEDRMGSRYLAGLWDRNLVNELL
ncbi:HET-domain-containing protein [Viridothelium virens]|uniref:HET-domain-containing protein n=1 Tax=Viridothelium virens TaxID=1048519 RepID=A0A6A6HPS1_VIRVR|nr:HET-domain-containing protein [Viridothelium virens]